MEEKIPKSAGRPQGINKNRKELWLYLSVGIIALMGLVTVVAVCYGVITAQNGPGGEKVVRFPLFSWLAGMIFFPACLLFAVHSAGVGLFPAPPAGTEEEEARWQAQLPERLAKVYRLLKGAPIAVLLLALLAAAGTLATIDGVLHALVQMTKTLSPYIPHLVFGSAAVLCCAISASVWYKIRCRKLEAEYAFRRDVFAKSGILITDKKHVALPTGGAPRQDGAETLLESGPALIFDQLPVALPAPDAPQKSAEDKKTEANAEEQTTPAKPD